MNTVIIKTKIIQVANTDQWSANQSIFIEKIMLCLRNASPLTK